jgi:hypothetical protein
LKLVFILLRLMLSEDTLDFESCIRC